jgi:hypothetical protein
MKLYAYCLIEDSDAPPETLQGIAGAEVRLLKTENFSLLVSDFAGDAVPVNSDNALAHAAVVRSVLDRTTPLPFRFGTLGTEEQLRSYVTARRDALLAKFVLVRGCVEMNVKIISEGAGTQAVEAELPEKPGTSFLLQKRQEILGSEEAQEVAGWLESVVREYVRDKTFKTNVTSQLLLAAAHLVKREAVSQYRDGLKAARLERPELKFLVSGPWPPYSFANIDL